jgi:hypothetical protein
MSFTSILAGAAQGFLMSGGNPIGAAVGGLGGALTGNPGATSTGNATGNATNALLAGAENADMAQNALMDVQQMQFQTQLQQQSNQFNDALDEKSEMGRETNALQSAAMKQREADNEITKEFIKSI